MTSGQGDLFSESGFPAERSGPVGDEGPAIACSSLSETGLIAALEGASMADCLAIVAEIGRRKPAAAVAALERLCRRFTGFGLHQIVPEQAAALDALVSIGERTAAEAVARLISRSVVQGPGLKKAVFAAADLGSSLPSSSIGMLLSHDDAEVRAAACRCVDARSGPEIAEALLALLDDLHSGAAEVAACALGRMGRREAIDILLSLLRRKPSAEIIEAVVPIADDDCIVLLGRLAREDGGLYPAVLDALDAIDHPRAEKVAATLRDTPPS